MVLVYCDRQLHLNSQELDQGRELKLQLSLFKISNRAELIVNLITCCKNEVAFVWL